MRSRELPVNVKEPMPSCFNTQQYEQQRTTNTTMEQHSSVARTAVYFNNAGVTLLSKGHYVDALDCLTEAVTLMSLCWAVPDACRNSESSRTFLALYHDSLTMKLQLVSMLLAQTRSKSQDGLWNILSLHPAADHYEQPSHYHHSTLIRIEELANDPDEEYITQILPACMLLNYAVSQETLQQMLVRGACESLHYYKSCLVATASTPYSYLCCAPPPIAPLVTLLSSPLLTCTSPTTLLLDHALHVLGIRGQLDAPDWTCRLTGTHMCVALAILHRHPQGLGMVERHRLHAAAAEMLRVAPILVAAAA